MINPTNVVGWGVLDSITNSHSHVFEVETTLDHEFDDDECEDTVEGT